MTPPDPALRAWVDQETAAVRDRLDREIAGVRSYLNCISNTVGPTEKIVLVNATLRMANPDPEMVLTVLAAALIRLAELPPPPPEEHIDA